MTNTRDHDLVLQKHPVPGHTARILNGAEAMGIAYWLSGARIAFTFPITPQSEVIDYFASCSDIECIRSDSEYGVIAGAEGVLWGGERCAVATSSQGLILMSEVMWEVAGNRLPMVMGVFNRGLKGPGWCLGTQQNDALFMRDTGWLQFYCETSQEVLDFVLIGHRLAETMCLPLMVVGDGFYLSHELEEVLVPDVSLANEFVGKLSCPGMPLDTQPASYGGLVPPALYSHFYEVMHRDVIRAGEEFEDIARAFACQFGREYHLVDGVGLDDARVVVISAGTICGTARQVIADMRERGERIGLVTIHAFRPFPGEEIVRLVQSSDKILVLDRNIAPGAGGIFASHVRAALHAGGFSTPVFGIVCGLGGLDVTPAMVEMAIRCVCADEVSSRQTLFLTENGIG